jgi:hypothetical protein
MPRGEPFAYPCKRGVPHTIATAAQWTVVSSCFDLGRIAPAVDEL